MLAPNDASGLRMIGLILATGASAILVFALFLREVLAHPVEESVVEPDPLWHPEPAHTVWDGEDDR